MIVVDSSVWIAHLRDEESPAVLAFRDLQPDLIMVGDVIMLEVLRGVANERDAAALQSRFFTYGVVTMLDPPLAATAAAYYRALRRRGLTIRTFADLVIASFCIAHDHHLLHQDRDFDHFERHLGLKVLH